jgi:hypothetical protein
MQPIGSTTDINVLFCDKCGRSIGVKGYGTINGWIICGICQWEEELKLKHEKSIYSDFWKERNPPSFIQTPSPKDDYIKPATENPPAINTSISAQEWDVTMCKPCSPENPSPINIPPVMTGEDYKTYISPTKGDDNFGYGIPNKDVCPKCGSEDIVTTIYCNKCQEAL